MSLTSTSLAQENIPSLRWLCIIPPLLITCIIFYMDRVNIAFAMSGGMDADLGISASMAGLARGIFFIGYLFLQVPCGKLAVYGNGKRFIGWSVLLKAHIWWSYAALVGGGVFIQSAAGVFWSIPPRLFNAKVAGGAINALGNLGGFCGPNMVGVLIVEYSKDAGVCSLAVSLAIASLLALTVSARCDAAHKGAV